MKRLFPNGQNYTFGCNTPHPLGASYTFGRGRWPKPAGYLSSTPRELRIRIPGACLGWMPLRCLVLWHRHGGSQWQTFKVSPWCTKFPGSGTGIMPVKGSYTIIKPLALALASGHSRYITVIPERALVTVGKLPLHIAVINL